MLQQVPRTPTFGKKVLKPRMSSRLQRKSDLTRSMTPSVLILRSQQSHIRRTSHAARRTPLHVDQQAGT